MEYDVIVVMLGLCCSGNSLLTIFVFLEGDCQLLCLMMVQENAFDYTALFLFDLLSPRFQYL